MNSIIKSEKGIAFLFFLSFCLFCTNNLAAQDLYAIADGDWNTNGTWSATSGGASCACTPADTDNVHIGELGTRTVTIENNGDALSITVYNNGTLEFIPGASPVVQIRLTIESGGLSVEAGGTVTATGTTPTNRAYLKINGDLTVANTGTITNLEEIRFESDATISGAGSINCPDAELKLQLGSAGNVDVVNDLTSTFNVNFIRLTNPSQTFTNNETLTTVNQLRMNTNCTVTNNGTLVIGGDLECNASDGIGNHIQNNGIMSVGADISMTDYAFTITNTGTFTHSGDYVDVLGVETITNGANATWTSSAADHSNIDNFNCSAVGSSFVYALAGAQDVFVPTDGSYYNLTIQGSGTKTASGSFDIDNNMTIDGTATFNIATNDANLTIGQNWTNNSTFTSDSETITFNSSTAAQSIGGTSGTTFYTLTLNNTSGTSPQFTFGANITANNTLNMTSGDVELSSSSLTLGTVPATTGTLNHTSGDLINGDFIRYYSTGITVPDLDQAGLFPMRDTGGNPRPIYISAPSTAPTTGGSISVSISTSTTASGITAVDDNGTDIVSQHNSSWDVTTGGTLAGGSYNLRVNGTGFGTIDDVADLRLMTSGGVVGTHGATGGSTSDPVINRTGLSFGELSNSFHIGSTDAVNSPLPIDLLSFEGIYMLDRVKFNWHTATETNNEYFSIERSADGIDFYEIVRVNGAGTINEEKHYSATDFAPLWGDAYYRLKQTDFDGKYEIFNAIKVNSKRGNQVSVYPNPLMENKFYIQISRQQSDITINLYDINGMAIGYNSIKEDSKIEIIPTKQLHSGIYLVVVIIDSEVSYHRILKK